MRILIATDAFPPVCGGSGWSTYELARGLRERGHHLVVVQPRRERSPRPVTYDGFEVLTFPAPAPPVPFVRNYVRNERLFARLSLFLERLIVSERIDLVHGQHMLTSSPSVRAARAAGVPSVCTVRDYWPVCYWGDLTRDADAGGQCPACTPANMTACVRPHAGTWWPLALPWIPYMRANLAMKQRDLSRADVVVAVSRRMAADLAARAPLLASTRIMTMPNPVDVPRLRGVAERSARPMPERYALFVGKLARNKGVAALVDMIARTPIGMPLAVVGDGPDRALIEDAARRQSVDLRVIGWVDPPVVFQWMQHAAVIIFPSGWQEPLSRTLLEASAIGVPIAAMDTGGTSDIVVHEETGLLSTSVEGLGADVARLSADAGLGARLAAGARRRAETHFAVPVVLDRVERLYRELIEQARARREGRAP